MESPFAVRWCVFGGGTAVTRAASHFEITDTNEVRAVILSPHENLPQTTAIGTGVSPCFYETWKVRTRSESERDAGCSGDISLH